jgi:hypothetical protein
MQLKPGIADISQHAGKTVEPGMVKYKDIDGDGVITTDDRTTIGNGQPDWYGGITNTFNYKKQPTKTELNIIHGIQGFWLLLS